MSRVELAPEVADDFERILEHLTEYEVKNTTARVRNIIQAIDVLKTNPLIGRPVVGDLRELIIGRGSQGYVALYCYIPENDTVFVLALRNQREAGHKRNK